ncbi:MAG: ABC transporter permease [Alphaproteobacteria bacterium]
MTFNMPQHKRLVGLARLILLCTFLTIWELLGQLNQSALFFISCPSQVFPAFMGLVLRQNLFSHFMTTAAEAFVGSTLGTFVGTAIGLTLWYSSFVATVLHPFILVAGSIPLITLAPLFIVWFGIGFQMKVALAFFSTVFLALAQSYRGALEANACYSEVLCAMRASKTSIFKRAILPGSLNWVFQSMRLNIGLGLLGAFLGEFIASQSGLGYLILRAASLYDMPNAISAATGIAILAIIFDRIATLIESNSIRITEVLTVPKIIWKRNNR